MLVCETPVLTFEVMCSMPTIVDTASSILRVTSVSICDGGTPPYETLTVTNGKLMSGWFCTPSLGKLSRPPMTRARTS